MFDIQLYWFEYLWILSLLPVIWRERVFFIFACCFNLRLYYNIWFVFHHKKSSSNLYISFLLTKNVCYISICLYKKKEECKNVHTKCWQIQIVPLPQPYVTLADAWLSSQGALVLFFFLLQKIFLDYLVFQSFVFEHVMHVILISSYVLNHIPTFLLTF